MMDVNFIKKICVFPLCLPIALTHIAGYAEDNILCPAVSTVQLSYKKLNTAQKIQDKYIAYTATSFGINGMVPATLIRLQKSPK